MAYFINLSTKQIDKMLSQILNILTKAAHVFCFIVLLYKGMAVYTGNATTGTTAVGTATTTATDAGGCTVTGAAAIIINTRTVTTVAGGTSGATTTITCTGTAGARTTRQLKHNPTLKYLHPPPEKVTITLPASENNNNRTIK